MLEICVHTFQIKKGKRTINSRVDIIRNFSCCIQFAYEIIRLLLVSLETEINIHVIVTQIQFNNCQPEV